jgi:hypothetical protein
MSGIKCNYIINCGKQVNIFCVYYSSNNQIFEICAACKDHLNNFDSIKKSKYTYSFAEYLEFWEKFKTIEQAKNYLSKIRKLIAIA